MIKTTKCLLGQSYNSFKSYNVANPLKLNSINNYKFSQNKNTFENNEQQNHQTDQNQNKEGPIPDTLIKNDQYLNKFMNKVYKTTGFSIAAYLGISYALSFTPVIQYPLLCVLSGFPLINLGVVAFLCIPQKTTTVNLGEGKTKEIWENSFSRILGFSTIVGSMALMTAPLMSYFIAANPIIVPMAACTSLMVMGGASAYSMYQPLGSFNPWESTLCGGLSGMLGMNLTGLGAIIMFGPNPFSMACFSFHLYGCLGLFVSYQMVDTHYAIQEFKSGKYDHLMHAQMMFTNFANLFIRIGKRLMNFFKS